MKQHMLTHKIRDMPPHMFGNSTSRSQSSESAQSYGSSYYPSKDYNQRSVSTEQIHDTISTDEKRSIADREFIDDDASSIHKEQMSYKDYYENNRSKSELNSMPNISSMPSKFKFFQFFRINACLK